MQVHTFLDEWIKIKIDSSLKEEENFDKILFTFSSTLECYQKVLSEYKIKNKNESCDFNFFSFFKINETKHSELLAFLLNPYETHGQGKLFLNLFLEKIGIEDFDDSKWTVTAEKERIDILLTRLDPHSVIIIENKSNWAIDQPHQLYRYWYDQIHSKNLNIDYESEECKKRFKIIYLTPDSSKMPSEHSLKKPQDLSCEYDDIKIVPQILDFFELSTWLEQSIEQLNAQNHKLKSYLQQYFELLKNIG